ncbi:hypothetical protein [Rosistilla oblonga]|uniref:hypothetical protein n=1 Tax=Rosistilla oblonga TaxID=2527990 RepID=UPI0018D27094|nr:hypothetical protein [Rosistilla oblonga]
MITTIDQQNGSGGIGVSSLIYPHYIGLLGPAQSFTANATKIDAAEFRLIGDITVRLDLLDGGAYNSPLLTSSSLLTLTPGSGSTHHFDFLQSQALIVGNAYTLKLTPITTGFLVVDGADTNPYAGGIAFGSSGTPAPNHDFVFTTGTHATAVPEPSSLAFLCSGLIIAMGANKKVRSRGQKLMGIDSNIRPCG